MGNDNVCVFCGETLGAFRNVGFDCARVYQPCCRNCAKELKELSEDEQCRRALRFGFAQQPEKLQARIEVITTAEEHRPACLRCGAKMKFSPVQWLDNTPMRDGFLSEGFEVLPAYCESCGKYEFYNPHVVNKNKFLAYLIGKDTEL